MADTVYVPRNPTESHLLPITVHPDGERGAILVIQEDWFERLEPVYRYFERLNGAIGVEKAPAALDEAIDLINDLVVEFGVIGWVFSVSLLYCLRWAAANVIGLGKLVFKERGWGGEWGDKWGRNRQWAIEVVD